MRALIVVCIALLALGQKEPEGPTPETPEIVRVLAIQGTDEGRGSLSIDPALLLVEEVLTPLPYDTFRDVASHEITAAYGKSESVVLNDTYSYHCRVTGLSEEEEVVLEVHVNRTQGDSVVEALRATGRLARGKAMVFRGFEMPEGELIIITAVARPQEEGSDGAGGGSDAGDPQGSRGSGGETSEETDGSGADGATPSEMAELVPEIADEREGDPNEEPETASIPISANTVDEGDALPPELANLEGVLRALEEIDQREQANARSRRLESSTKGAWW